MKGGDDASFCSGIVSIIVCNIRERGTKKRHHRKFKLTFCETFVCELLTVFR